MISINEYNVFGLDIGDFTLRLIGIEKRGKKFHIVTQNELPLPEDSIIDGEIKKPDIFIQSVKKIVATAHGKKIRTNRVVSVLPETKTFIKLLKISSDSTENLPKNLIQEMTRHIPYSMDEIYFDWQLLNVFDKKGENDILAGAAPIQTVDTYLSALKSAGLIPVVLEIEAAAIMRSLTQIQRTQYTPDSPPQAQIIIDFGATRTSLIVCDKNTIQFTMSLPVSGNDITKKIGEKLDLDYKKAEKAKILCGLDKDKCKGVMKTILMDSINQLIKKIQETIFFYEEQNGKSGIVKEIVLCGGGAYLMDIDTTLYEAFHIPIKISDPTINIAKVDKTLNLTKNNILSYATAIGLALRGFEI